MKLLLFPRNLRPHALYNLSGVLGVLTAMSKAAGKPSSHKICILTAHGQGLDGLQNLSRAE